MTVGEMFDHEKITIQHVIDIQDESEYWDRAGRFVEENWETEFRSLTSNQQKWMNAIYDNLVEMRIKRKNVFR